MEDLIPNVPLPWRGQPPERLLGEMAAWLERHGEAEAAVTYRLASLKVAETSRTAYDLGKGLMRLGRPEEAVPAFERAVALLPDHEPSRFELAKALAQSGRTEEALKCLDDLLARVPQHPAAKGLRLGLLQESGRWEEMVAFARVHPEVLASRLAQIRFALALHRLGRRAEFDVLMAGLKAATQREVRIRLRKREREP